MFTLKNISPTICGTLIEHKMSHSKNRTTLNKLCANFGIK